MTLLNAIVARKKVEVEQRKLRGLLPQVDRQSAPLSAALSPAFGPTRLIAEIKRKSPSKGTLNADLDVAEFARTYVAAGAQAISVLTDEVGFGGTLGDLILASQTVRCPLLRKDFVVDTFQIDEAKRAGAGAVLLIVAALSPSQVVEFRLYAESQQLDALIEVHDAVELDIALSSGAKLVGINNRNLHTFEVDLGVSELLLPSIPRSVLTVCESGIFTPADVRRLKDCGASNFLVGESLVKAGNVAEAVQALVRA
jgi:indole-3-glycerol phosphate synthase